MTLTISPPVTSTTPATRRIELAGLVLATVVMVSGVMLTGEAKLARAQLLTAASDAAAMMRTPDEFRRAVAMSLSMLLIGFYGLHAYRRLRRSRGDGLLLPAAAMLCGLGMMAMITLRDPPRESLLAQSFGSGVLIGCVVSGLVMRINVERFRSFTYLPLLGAVLLSVVLMVFGAGPGRSGVKVNLWGAQPVEVIRLLELLFLAGYLGSRWEYLRSLPRLGYAVPLFIGIAASLTFYVAQKDLGPALVMGVLFLAMYSIACRRVGLAVTGLALLGTALWIGYDFGIPPTVRTRVAIWLSPWNNGLRGGDQVAQGLWSFATGARDGAGPGLGDTHFVPAAHTDFVLAVIGEELGFAGLAATLCLCAVVGREALRIAQHAHGDYSRFLALGIALSLVLQWLLIAAGVLGLFPLSGVATPFLSYGKSAMVVNLAGIGMLLSISDRASPQPAFASTVPIRWLQVVLGTLGIAVATRAALIQLRYADQTIARPALTMLADGTYRFEDNPRLLRAARDLLPRGNVLDRNGLPLAFTGQIDMARFGPRFAELGVDLARAYPSRDARCYPLEGRTYHLLGDVRSERGWTASNTSFVERDAAAQLRGFEDHAATVALRRPDDGGIVRITRHDYSALIPLLRERYEPDRDELRQLVTRPRNVTLSLDARLQSGVATLMERALGSGDVRRGAAIVVDVDSGDVLAAVSYPWPTNDTRMGDEGAELDRVRYGLYTPGSTFKLVTSIAALRRSESDADAAYICERLPDGRVGTQLRGWSRPIRDDRLDVSPHGTLTLPRALIVSCNAYFAQLAVGLGARALYDTAQAFNISVAVPNTPARLRGSLPYAGFGQGEVVVSPAQFVQVVRTIAAGGVLSPQRWSLDPAPRKTPARRLMSRAAAAQIADAMRGVVTSGTGRVLSANATPIAGKTGTAELASQPSHSWFAGFAPYGSARRRIAFVVLVENGGYGAKQAAPLAGAIVDVARDLHIIQ
ncbi:MAG TPA: FtsW/RodA/SpoVE family cell cycle protein [Vicinamibacterales bacterium]